MVARKQSKISILDKQDNRSNQKDKHGKLPTASSEEKTSQEKNSPTEKAQEGCQIISPSASTFFLSEETAEALGEIYLYHGEVASVEVDIGLDISSAVTGVVFLDDQGTVLKIGHVGLESVKYKNLFDKADAVIAWVKENVPRGAKIRRVFVEENAKGYSKGFSNAQTLFVLAKINILVSYLSHKLFNVPVIDVNVTSARSKIGYKDVRAIKRPVKEKVREFVLATRPELPFATRVVTVGVKKGTIAPAKGAEDEIDAYVICRGGQLSFLAPKKKA